MNVVIRADASTEIGSGHVMRCLTLAEGLLRQDSKVVFICRELPGNMCNFLASRGIDVVRLPVTEHTDNEYISRYSRGCREQYARWLGVNEQQDALDTCKAIGELNVRPNWLIVDHYALGFDWEQTLRSCTERIFIIDDLADRPHECDVLLDQNLCEHYESRYSELVPKNCQLLLGPHFALLRPEFREAHDRARVRTGEIRKMLVFFGGSDPSNMTETALRAIQRLELPDVIVDVVVGNLNLSWERIEKLCADKRQFVFHYQTKDMASLMETADLFIGAGGSTTWERMSLGLPSIVVAIAENQVPSATYLGKTGFIYYVGRTDDLEKNQTEHILAEAIQSVMDDKKALEHCSDRCLRQVDGRGMVRVVEVLKKSKRH